MKVSKGSLFVDKRGNTIFVGVVRDGCPRCLNTEVLGLTSEEGEVYVGWCPCGTVYNDQGIVYEYPTEKWKDDDFDDKA